MRVRDLVQERTESRGGIDVEHVEDAEQPNIVGIIASTHGRELGRVKFLRQGNTVVALDLAVKPEYQGQGIARIMYDYAKELGYKVLRSAEQTDAGAGFWDKYRGTKEVWESESDQVLYHATYKPLLKSIQAQGLGGRTQANWEDSEPGVVYLARDPNVAISYAETSEAVPEEWLDEIVVLAVDATKLDSSRLHRDRNVQDSDSTLEYHGIIPAKLFKIWKQELNEVNSPGELFVDPTLIERFTDRGWEVLGEGRDQIVLARPGTATTLKIVGEGSLPRRAEIRRYVTFFRAHQRNPHFPRVGPDRELTWNGRRYYAYTQERLQPLSGEEDIMDYLEYAMGEIGHGESPDYDRIPPGLSVEQIDGLVMAIDDLFDSGIATEYGFDLANVANIMQRANGQLVIVDPVSSFDDELTEVKILSKVKGKGADLSNLPRSGGRIPTGQETRYLGQKQADLGTYEIWRDYIGGQAGYHLYDPESRRVMITAFGSRYQRNPHSFIIGGLYAAPGNPIRAAEFYRALIQDLDLTLISDRKQSPGGQRVWQQLERFPDIEIYGFDTRTGKVLNFGPQDTEMYAIASGDVKDREGRYVANNIRMVATKR